MPMCILRAKTSALNRNLIHAITCPIHGKYMLIHTKIHTKNIPILDWFSTHIQPEDTYWHVLWLYAVHMYVLLCMSKYLPVLNCGTNTDIPILCNSVLQTSFRTIHNFDIPTIMVFPSDHPLG